MNNDLGKSLQYTGLSLYSLPEKETAVNHIGPLLSVIFAEKYPFQITPAKVALYEKLTCREQAQIGIYSHHAIPVRLPPLHQATWNILRKTFPQKEWSVRTRRQSVPKIM